MKHNIHFCNISFHVCETFHESKGMKKEQEGHILVKFSKLRKLGCFFFWKWKIKMCCALRIMKDYTIT